jgi:hypothetical protein
MKIQTLLENWRRYAVLNEAEESKIPDDKVDMAISQAMDAPSYTEFVTKLSKIAGDPKVQAVLKAGMTDGAPQDEQVKITKITIPVKSLQPTQSEVDLEKSLNFPLQNIKAFNNCFSSGPITIMSPIVTAEGKYVIDGHHRWSQVYAMNEDATMVAYNMEFPSAKGQPLNYLKIVQVAIAADIGKVPSQVVKSQNLFTIPLDQSLKYWIFKTSAPIIQDLIAPEVKLAEKMKVEVQVKDRGTAVDALYKGISRNIESMRSTSQPVEGAPSRGYMPQTDDANNWIGYAIKGVANFSNPSIKDPKQASSAAKGKTSLEVPEDKLDDAKRALIKAGILSPDNLAESKQFITILPDKPRRR